MTFYLSPLVGNEGPGIDAKRCCQVVLFFPLCAQTFAFCAYLLTAADRSSDGGLVQHALLLLWCGLPV
jgi:hypothetical protein